MSAGTPKMSIIIIMASAGMSIDCGYLLGRNCGRPQTIMVYGYPYPPSKFCVQSIGRDTTGSCYDTLCLRTYRDTILSCYDPLRLRIDRVAIVSCYDPIVMRYYRVAIEDARVAWEESVHRLKGCGRG